MRTKKLLETVNYAKRAVLYRFLFCSEIADSLLLFISSYQHRKRRDWPFGLTITHKMTRGRKKGKDLSSSLCLRD